MNMGGAAQGAGIGLAAKVTALSRLLAGWRIHSPAGLDMRRTRQ
jgi:hypothetical protein